MNSEEIKEKLKELEKVSLLELNSIKTHADLEEWRIKFLGKKGELSQILRNIVNLPADLRPVIGQSANSTKVKLEQIFQDKKNDLDLDSHLRSETDAMIDVTLPGYNFITGQLHPVTQILNQILKTFQNMGFQVIDGPEVEWDYYNFEALNIPKDHPARDMFDTFYISRGENDRDMLLRTHTSPMQVRIMQQIKPPIRVVVPGKVYRYEATDATHEFMFYQVEGLAVDTDITMADLKGTLTNFARNIFGQDRKVRFRTDYFPFVEPGVDFAIDCFACKGLGCRLCSETGWLEIMGAGMVHPDVLERVGYDSKKYRGFAFGLGPERVAMLKHGIDDIRLFYGNDLRFLRQFN